MKLNPDKIIGWLSKRFEHRNPGVIAGINDDDCAVLNIANISKLVVTNDFLNSNPIAIQQGFGTLYDLGRLLVASNISDLLCSGAKPIAFISSIMMKKSSSTADYKNIMEGISFELEKLGIPLIGGDSKLGKEICLAGTALGIENENSKLFLKNGAKPNDDIFVSGCIGSVSAGLSYISNSSSQDESLLSWSKAKIITPDLPVNLSSKLAHLKCINSGTDLSDGLCADIYDLCKTSGVGCIIDVENIPIFEEVMKIAKILNQPDWAYPLTIGGDFQFVFTSNKMHRSKILETGGILIGKITEENEYYLENNERKISMTREGHEDSRNLSFAEEVSLLLSKLNDFDDR